MDLNFCVNWQGDGSPGQNKFCRDCPQRAGPCQQLWAAFRGLANPTLEVPGPTQLRLHRRTPAGGENLDIMYFQVNARWNLPIEDFLHFVKTGCGGAGQREIYDDPMASPSRTTQGHFVKRLMSGLPPTAVAAVRAIPRK